MWSGHPVFQRRKFFQGRALRGSGVKDISFFDPSGSEMSDEGWEAGFVKCLGVRLAGDVIDDVDERGEPILDDTALILLNAHHETIPFTLPKTRDGQVWERVVDTEVDEPAHMVAEGGEPYDLRDRSMAVFFTRSHEEVPLSALQARMREARPEEREPSPKAPSA